MLNGTFSPYFWVCTTLKRGVGKMRGRVRSQGGGLGRGLFLIIFSFYFSLIFFSYASFFHFFLNPKVNFSRFASAVQHCNIFAYKGKKCGSNLQLVCDCRVLHQKCNLEDFVYMPFSTRRSVLAAKIACDKVVSSKTALICYFL